METLIFLAIIASTGLNLILFFFIILKINEMALTIQDFEHLLDQVAATTEKVAADVERLWEKLAASGLSSAEEQVVYERIMGALSALQALDDRTPEPDEPED